MSGTCGIGFCDAVSARKGTLAGPLCRRFGVRAPGMVAQLARNENVGRVRRRSTFGRAGDGGMGDSDFRAGLDGTPTSVPEDAHRTCRAPVSEPSAW